MTKSKSFESASLRVFKDYSSDSFNSVSEDDQFWLRSVENYAQAYKNVLKLLDHGFAPVEVAGILRMGPRRVGAYVKLVCEHHPDILDRNPHLRERTAPPAPAPPRGHMT